MSVTTARTTTPAKLTYERKKLNESETSTCRGCGREIFWIETRSGKKAPVDIERTHAEKDDTWMVNDEGKFFKANRGDEGHTPHFATCPQADKFRKERT